LIQVSREAWSVLVQTSYGADREYRQIPDLEAALEPVAAVPVLEGAPESGRGCRPARRAADRVELRADCWAR
jgi:hypothetical protein